LLTNGLISGNTLKRLGTQAQGLLFKFVEWTIYAVAVLTSYFLGSIPTGYLFAKWKGIDIRTVGSGNIGATNAFRVLGKRVGTIVLLVDALKGFLACVGIGGLCSFWLGNVGSQRISRESIMLLSGVCSILGHNFTCWLRFKGGKGVATSAGVLLALTPLALALTFVIWLVVFKVSRYVSLASIVAAIVMPVIVAVTGSPRPTVLAMTFLGLLAIYKHRSNFKRLLDGTENKVGSGKK